MRTLLVIAEQSGLAAAVAAVLAPERYRIVAVTDWREVEPLVGQGIVEACILDAELNTIQPIRVIGELRRGLPDCPLLVYASARQWEWEEEAWLLGITHLLAKPVRGPLLNRLLDRLWETPPAVAPRPPLVPRVGEHKLLVNDEPPLRALEVLRQFSGILTHSLCTEALLKQFLLLLREVIGVNRAAIFLRQPPGGFRADASLAAGRRLHSACALGLASSLLQHLELSLDAGIGLFVHRFGRILRRGAEEAGTDREIQKEFELLGAQVAIPILDRETLLGVAVFDGPVTGEPFGNEELTLIFHLLEELGLALRNSWLHDQLAANHETMADMLNQIGSACILVGRDLEVLHANQTARTLFAPATGGKMPLEFSSLPQPLGALVYEAVRGGAGRQTTKYRPPAAPDTVFRVVVIPFHRQQSPAPNAVLLLIEDFTEHERAQTLEIEAANLRLVKTIAEQLAHEIGNSLAPISAHQQMLADRYTDPDFRASLSTSLEVGVHRISRLCRQMLYLARDGIALEEPLPVATLVSEAFQSTLRHFPDKVPTLDLTEENPVLRIKGDRAALSEALAELLLNGLQATANDPKVQVRCLTDTGTDGTPRLVLEVRDSGGGFTPEAASHATDPFFSTKIVGLGLGLTVARKIIQAHRGQLEIVPTEGEVAGLVRITLPLATD